MNRIATILILGSLLVAAASHPADAQTLRANEQELIEKYGDDPFALQQAKAELRGVVPLASDVLLSLGVLDDHYVARAETEPNNDFGQADNINDVLALEGVLPEYNGKLIQAALSAGDVDVFRFTVDTTKMYYFASTHSFLESGEDGLAVNMRLYHESDLDTTFVEDAGGITGNDKRRGNILGRDTDGRNGSGDFRLTGWTSPVDPATGAKLTGDFYLWIYNEDGNAGTYYMTAYSIDRAPWVSKGEPNQTFEQALTNADAQLPADAVVRTFMLYNPDTVKVVVPPVPTQGNSVYPQLLAEGDEDVDHFRLTAKPGHILVVETMPYFGWYRDNDGSIGPGGSRLSDPRIRVYNADYTDILAEDDDGAREDMDGPNNIHSRIVLDTDEIGVTSESPLWLWVSAWASQTREPGRNVDNSDPGRFMYDVYVTQYSKDPVEMEPNDEAATATSIGARTDTTVSGSFASAADVDYYRVFMHEVRMYTLFTAGAGGEVGIELYREYETDSGTELTANLLTDPVGRPDGNNVLVSGFVPEESGAYLVKVTGAAAGDYRLGVVDKGEIYDGRTSNEPDDEAADALAQDALEVGPGAAARTGMIYPAGDVDHYHFTVSTGTDVTLTLSGTNSDLVDDFDVQMTLLAPDGSEVAANTNAASFTASQDGTYIVRVQATDGADVGFYILSGGEPFAEEEGNDSFETANLIALGGNVYEAALTSGDVDYYQFTLEAGKLYSFRSLDNGTGGPLDVGFYDTAGGATLLDESGWVDNYDGDNFKIASIIPLETKTYYLSVAGGAGPYKLTSRINANFSELAGKGEPNNSAAEADAQGAYQAFGADVEYALFNAAHPRLFGDEDWFRVELGAGQTLEAETKPVGDPELWNKDTDTRLVFFAADGTTELANDDDGGNEWYSLATYTATGDEVVYVQVRTSRSADDADDRSLGRGDYLLNIDVNAQEVEPNNDFTAADGNALTSGFVTASFEEDNDAVDIYKLSLEADHIYHIRTLRPDEGYGGTFTASLYRASDTGTNLLDAANAGYNNRYSGDNLKLNIIPDDTGDYFLRLEGDGSGAYQVGIKGRSISDLKTKGEPNDTIEEADVAGVQEFNAPGQPTTYMFYNADFPWQPGDPISTRYGDDTDVYKYELMAGDTLVAETSPVDGPLWSRDTDMYMELYDGAGTLLAEDDDGGFDWHSRIEFVAPADAAYYVLVRSQDLGEGSDRDPTRAEYNLSVRKLGGAPFVVANEGEEGVPETFSLGHNYPNPFNPSTSFTFTVPQPSHVKVVVYNLLGQRVTVLVDGLEGAGTHTIRFDASNLASGMYIYRMTADGFSDTKKMILVK